MFGVKYKKIVQIVHESIQHDPFVIKSCLEYMSSCVDSNTTSCNSLRVFFYQSVITLFILKIAENVTLSN